MKIDEPDTPYAPPLEGDEVPELSLEDEPAAAVEATITTEDPEEWQDGREGMSIKEKQEKHDKFAQHRKDHYNMKAAMERARQMMAEEESS
eukprot:m.59237 g.59237  ORF g.59237 m.59237 type:complete len:91 (-) comp13814_c0_seq1:82-354(-)